MTSQSADLSALEARAMAERALQSAWDQGAIESRPLALLLVTFDRGDRALTPESLNTLERALHVHCGRHRDIFLRRQTDEFLALLPGTPPAGARRVGEQIVEAMRAGDRTTTVSVGVAVCVPDDQQSATDLLHRAERLLRSAQDRGGNRCHGGSDKDSSQPAPSPMDWLRKQVKGEPKPGERRSQG